MLRTLKVMQLFPMTGKERCDNQGIVIPTFDPR